MMFALATLGTLFASSVAVGARQGAEPATPLRLGQSVERRLAGSEAHVFRVALNAGECAVLTVEQRGIDVLVRVHTPGDRNTADFNAESQPQGAEHVIVVADATGDYTVDVKPVFARLPAGSFVIRFDDARPATDHDRAGFTAHELATEGVRLYAAARFTESLPRLEAAVEAIDRGTSTSDAYLGYVLGLLGEARRNSGDNATAEQTFLRAISIDDATVGREHLQTADAMRRLGLLYVAMSDLARAELMLEGALAIIERTLGPDHPMIVTFLRGTALLHRFRGDLPRAISETQRSLSIAERTLEENDFERVVIPNNLGDLYRTQGDFDRAQVFHLRALAELEHVYGPDDYRLANPLLGLGIEAREHGEYEQALRYLGRSHALREKALGSRHPQTVAILISIGNVYHVQGNYAKALDTFQSVLDALEPAGPNFDYTLMTLYNVARTLTAQGDLLRALEYQTRADRILEKNIALNLAIGSEREKIAFIDETRDRTSRTISLHVRRAPDDGAAAELAATALIQRKGRVLDALAGSVSTLRQRMTPEDQRLLDDLTTTTESFARMALAGPGRTPLDDYQKRLTALDVQREKLEDTISQRSAEFRAGALPVTLSAVQAALPADSALIEVGAYRPYDVTAIRDEDLYGDARYVAYVVRPSAIAGRDLGSAAAIDEAVVKLRAALRDPRRTDVADLARAVDARVMAPIRGLLGNARRILISPDGDLNLIPFEALVDEQHKYLVERYAISYLTSGRDLLRMQIPRASSGAPVVVADPAFGEPAAAVGNAKPHPALATTAQRAVTSGTDLSSFYFAPLAGTAREALAIKAMFPEVRLLMRDDATKSALEQVASPRILHIATHGFFLSNPAEAVENPLLRSGLALSGANLRKDTKASGIFTALEASNLNLWGTRLVTLSACDTGVGEVKTGEGVYGLRRAFFLAGAETLVMSLWPVSDLVTRETMTAYYRGLKEGLGRGDALRQAQLAFLKQTNHRHPYYWAGFIQAGDWRPLDEP